MLGYYNNNIVVIFNETDNQDYLVNTIKYISGKWWNN